MCALIATVLLSVLSKTNTNGYMLINNQYSKTSKIALLCTMNTNYFVYKSNSVRFKDRSTIGICYVKQVAF